MIRWLAARAADAPENFGHLLSLLEAERSWAAGDFDAAALAFDAARGEVSGRQRPWHRALITERAGPLCAGAGLATHRLSTSRRGPPGVSRLGSNGEGRPIGLGVPRSAAAYRRCPANLVPTGQATSLSHGSMLSTGTIDLLAILSASQALSSETSIEGLHARVVDVLAAMTGATEVQLLLWSEDHQEWSLPAPAGGGAGSLGGAGSHHDVPGVGAPIRPAAKRAARRHRCHQR